MSFLFLDFFAHLHNGICYFPFFFPSSNNTIRKYDGPNRSASRNKSTPQGNDHKHRRDPQLTIISWYEYRLRIFFLPVNFFSIIFSLFSEFFIFIRIKRRAQALNSYYKLFPFFVSFNKNHNQFQDIITRDSNMARRGILKTMTRTYDGTSHSSALCKTSQATHVKKRSRGTSPYTPHSGCRSRATPRKRSNKNWSST